jgi:hypothetical protein
MNNQRKLKTVFTLKSGKSIVVHMFEDECFGIYTDWLKYNSSKIVDDAEKDPNKINISKKNHGVIVETIGILLSEIAAIQINENSYGD